MAFKMRYQGAARQMTAPLYQRQTSTNVSTGESVVKYDERGNRIVSTPTTTTTTTSGYTIPAVEAPKPTQPKEMEANAWTEWKKNNPEEYKRRLQEKKNNPPNPPTPPNPVPTGGVTPGGSTPGSSGDGSPAIVVPDQVDSNTTWASVSEAPPVNYSTGENTQVVNTSKRKKGFKPFKWTKDLNIRFPKIRIGKLGIGNALFGARGILNPRMWANCKGGGCMRNPR